MRFLIIDNDSKRADKLKKMLFDFGPSDVFRSGRNAFKKILGSDLEKNYDALFINDYLDDFKNETIISEIRRKEAEGEVEENDRLLIIAVSDVIERKTVIEFFKAGCDEFFLSPFDKDTLYKKLERKTGIKPVSYEEEEKKLHEKVKNEILKSDIELPTLPDIFTKFRALVEKDADLSEISDLLNKDMTISAKLIRLSNSAFFGGVEKNTTVPEAVTRLGLSETHQIIAAICARDMFVSNNPGYKNILESLFQFTLLTSFVAQTLAEKFISADKGNPFVMALLGNLGRLFMIVVTSEIERKKLKSQKMSEELICSTVEKHHFIFCRKMLQKWDFPEDFIKKSVDFVYSENEAGKSEKISAIIRLALYISSKYSLFGPEYSNFFIEKIIEEEGLDLSLIEIDTIRNDALGMSDFLTGF
ncbi:MAG: HDOD domain-containing protein [Desulfobacteraceae bacterium]|nr:HDOD domain-containing protein [Desulfobacteraceae bacterium]